MSDTASNSMPTRYSVPLRLELLCGASNVDPEHPAYWDGSTLTHPKQNLVEQLATERGIGSCVQPGDPVGVYSDAYLYFRPDQLEDVVAVLAEAGWPGDILDIEGELTPEEEQLVRTVADREGWYVEGDIVQLLG